HEDPNSAGRQMPNHFGDKKRKSITGSSPVTTQVPHAVGFALASEIKNDPFGTFTTLGDGSTNQGDFHEGRNFAGVHHLPVITMVENNKYAISVPLDKQIASENIAVRADSYGMPGIVIDGNDPVEVYEAIEQARKRAMNGEGPTLIEAITDRLTAQSGDDNDRTYRTEQELKEMQNTDCLLRFKTYLEELNILTEEKNEKITEQIKTEINEATDYAERAADPDPATIKDYVYEMQGGE